LKGCARRRVSERNRRKAAELGAEMNRQGSLSFQSVQILKHIEMF